MFNNSSRPVRQDSSVIFSTQNVKKNYRGAQFSIHFFDLDQIDGDAVELQFRHIK